MSSRLWCTCFAHGPGHRTLLLCLGFLVKRQLAISQSSRGLGLVACLEGQKINNMPNMASRKFSYIPKVIRAA
jgi:hypothetical protein